VFTLEALVAGQFVREFKLEREITAEAPLRPQQGEIHEHCTLIDGRFYLVASPDRHLNHSCDPNAYLRFGLHSIDVVASRDVEPDSELTIDYLINNPGGDSWPCRCGAARCRGETGKSFFTLPESFQREYLPLLAPWFRERYRRELEHLT
jgi:hypothetical protein